MNRLPSFIDRGFVVRGPLSAFLWLLLLVYTGWEIYSLAHFGYAAISWHTHLMPYTYIWLIGFLIFTQVYRKKPSERLLGFFLIYSSVVFTFFLAEVFCLVSGIEKTDKELAHGFYMSPYEGEPNYYHKWKQGDVHILVKPEFSYPRPTNSLGFADTEWQKRKPQGETRILALGNSFTEGDGTAYDSTYTAFMRRQLYSSGDSFYIMNAGTCGSDPFNNYMNLKDFLLPYQPDIILQSLGTGDISSEILIRGGLERFQQDGTIRYRWAPWWEPVYAVSYVSRIFFALAGYNELLRRGVSAADSRRITRDLNDLFDRYSALCLRQHIALVVFLYPDLEEVRMGYYAFDFKAVINHLSAQRNIRVIDLMPSYQAYVKAHGADISAYYWREDRHNNAKGYQMMAESILGSIAPFLDSVKAAKTAVH